MIDPKHPLDHARVVHIMLNRGQVLSLVGQNERALADFQRGLLISGVIQDKKCQADCHLQSSDIYGSVNRYADMLDSAEKSLLLYQSVDDEKGQSESLTNIGHVHN